jgi:cytochrome c biogenesis protein CcdA
MLSRTRTRQQVSYGIFALSVVLVSLAGYLGYVLYPRFDLPAVTGIGLFVLATGAGIACFFSPCSFPLLVAMLGRATRREAKAGTAGRNAARFAAGLTTGAFLFLLLIGMVVALAGTAVFADVVFTSTEGIILRSVVGVLLIGLGLIQLNVLPIPLPPAQDLVEPLLDRSIDSPDDGSVLRYVPFGFGYLVAGFG